MPAIRFALFDTTVGPCGIAWGERGVVGVQLPEGGESATRARLRKRFADSREEKPTREVKRAIERIGALLRGEKAALGAIALDMDGVPPFHRRVYEAARAIAPGETLSYGEIATRIGAPGSARAVGQALGRNPFAIVVPCHRVLAANGKAGGFSANGGVETKLKLLSIEGARALEPSPLFAPTAGFDFDPDAALAHLRGRDPVLARLIEAAGPFRMELKSTSSAFFALSEAIVYQQLSGKAAATIFSRVCALFPRAKNGPTPEHILRASDEKLRGAGLSRAKLLSLRDLARRAKAGEIPPLAELRLMDDEAIIERLTAVRGVGRWTAEMFLMFRLGRPDVLPVGDYGVRKGFGLAFRKRGLPSPADVEKHGARWRPYRTVASWYLWRALELRKE
jgi:methylated-DNA-[protein]-cysteine S-methyltransferase